MVESGCFDCILTAEKSNRLTVSLDKCGKGLFDVIIRIFKNLAAIVSEEIKYCETRRLEFAALPCKLKITGIFDHPAYFLVR